MIPPDLVFREDPEVTNSGETSGWWAMHQQYSTWNCIHKQQRHLFTSALRRGEQRAEVVRVEVVGIYARDPLVLTPLTPAS